MLLASRSLRSFANVGNLRTLSSGIPSLRGMPPPFDIKDAPYNSASLNVGRVRVEDTADFATRLFATVTSMRHAGKSCMWLKVPADFSHYIPIASHYGFTLHHTRPKENQIMMVCWLEQGPSRIPAFATHHVGVAGCVTSPSGKLLVIQEKKERPIWKFPGGLADIGEELGAAAAREVKEETGVDCEFQSILAFRHQHDFQFGNSDLYFICRMKAITENLSPCSHEVKDVQWMSMEEIQAVNRHPMMATVLDVLKGESTREMLPEQQPCQIKGRPPYTLYSASPVADSSR